MLKAQELSDPNSCLNKAADDEPLFVLRAKDVASSKTIADWCVRRIDEGKNVAGDAQITDALKIAAAMTEWRAKQGKFVKAL